MKTLLVFSGLPGTGKTTIAKELARRLSAVYLRIDSLEHALTQCGAMQPEQLGPAGYHAAAAIAVDNLVNGLAVIADSVNPWPMTRRRWREAAEKAQARFIGIEVSCSNPHEHRNRVENRRCDLEGFSLPSWQDVLARDYVPWGDADIAIDTASESAVEGVERILDFLGNRPEVPR